MPTGPDKSPAVATVAETIPASAKPFGARPLRSFALIIALPAFLLYVAGAALVIGVLFMMSRDMDQMADVRGVTGMHAALDSFLNDLSNAVADEGTWDEAYLNVVVKPDPAWMDGTWGDAARLGQSYDAVFVTDSAGAVQFGEDAVGPIKGNVADRFPAARTMMRDLERGIASTGDATTVSGFAADKYGLAGLSGISIHQSSTNGINVPRQTRRILWIARHVTPALLQDMASRYQTPLASIVTTPDPDTSSIGLADADGNTAGTLAWTPDRPGDAAFTHALLIATAIYFGIGLLMVIGLGMIRRTMIRRAAAFEEALAAAAEHAHSGPILAGARRAAATVIDEDPELGGPADGVSAADFEIAYQPVFDLRAEQLIGAQAMLRWRKPDRTLLLQETLTPAENAALLDRVGILALRHATDEMAPLLGMLLTVLISPAQLQDPVFGEKVIGTLGATHFPANRLQLAVNTALLPDVSILREPVNQLRQLGVAIALADFAIGPASIEYADPDLADRIVLPREMVRDIDTNSGHHTLIEATINLAKSLDWAVTVPFVERKEEAARLLRLGCREFQGKLFAEPMPIAALTSLLLAPATRKAS